MKKVAFVFPGQGSQKVGMGQEIASANDRARSVFESADAALGEELSKLCFEGPEDQLQLTANTQPAVLTTSVALLRALDETPDVTAGHSLGEYTAHVCAGSLDLADGVRLVRQRGRFMQEAVPVGTGAMSAVLKLDDAAVIAICEETEGVVEAVNYNAPGQVVIAGTVEAVERASALVKERGGRAISLPVSAPFHCSLMKPAEEALAPHLETTPFADPTLPVYCNVDAAIVADAAASRDALLRQVSRPVRWTESVAKMVEDGVGLFVEIGAGAALKGMIRRIAKDVPTVNVRAPADIEPAKEAIRALRAG